MAVLVDSSLWIHQLRRSGDPSKRARVEGLLEHGEASWCPVVRLELWCGVTNDVERAILRRYASVLPEYPISDDVWALAIELADRARASGVTAPASDILIFACARVHRVDLAHDDSDFDLLAGVG